MGSVVGESAHGYTNDVVKTMRFDSDVQPRRTTPIEQAAVYDRRHEDQYAYYSHQMTDETKEAAGRFVVRTVPLLYGLLLGGLSDHLFVGVFLGLIGSIGLDLRMGEHSLALPLARRMLLALCPRATALARRLADRFEAAGVYVPARLRDLRCGIG